MTADVPVCAQCGSTAPLTSTEYGPLCQLCVYRQAEHDTPGYGLSEGTFGFRSWDGE